jgi:hypothetical protein
MSDLLARIALSTLLLATVLCSCGIETTMSSSTSSSPGVSFSLLRQRCNDDLNTERHVLATGNADERMSAAYVTSITYLVCAHDAAGLGGIQADMLQPLVGTWERLYVVWGQIGGGNTTPEASAEQLNSLNEDEQAAIAGIERYLGLPLSTPRV